MNIKFYFGTPGWGWKMYGIGWKTLWFLGFSIKDTSQEINNESSH